MRLGRYSTTAGKNRTIISLIRSAIKNGTMPLKMETRGTSGSIDFMTNTFKPMGGVIRLISVTTTTKMPNQTGSNPSDTTSGKKIQGFPVAEGDPVVMRVFGGDTVAVDAADIKSRDKLKKSVMVSASDMGLSAQNVRDLVEYIKGGK